MVVEVVPRVDQRRPCYGQDQQRARGVYDGLHGHLRRILLGLVVRAGELETVVQFRQLHIAREGMEGRCRPALSQPEPKLAARMTEPRNAEPRDR